MGNPGEGAGEKTAGRRTGRTARGAKPSIPPASPGNLFAGLQAVEVEKIEGLFLVFPQEDFRSLMEMVHRCIAVETARVEEAVAENNYGAAMIAAHKITGSSGNYAFLQVSKAAARVNDLLNSGNADRDALKALRVEADRAISDLEIVLERLS